MHRLFVRGEEGSHYLFEKRGGELTYREVERPRGAPLLVALPGRDVWGERLQMPIPEREIEAALPFQLEPRLPFPNPVYAHVRTGEEEVLGLAAPREAMQQAQEGRPDQVSCAPAALLQLLPESEQPQALLYIGSSEILFCIGQQRRLLAFRSLPPDASDGEILRTSLALSGERDPRLAYSQIFHLGADRPLPIPCERLETPIDPLLLGLGQGGLKGELPLFFNAPFSLRRDGRGFALFYSATLSLTCALLFWSHTHSSLPLQAELNEARSELRTLQAQADPFPLQPEVPGVAELLAWLQELPQMEGIRIESLRYNMTSLPNAAHPRDRYAVRVDLDFTAENATQARDLHDALLQGGDLLDPKSPVQWSAGRDGYKASFLLRDRTRYSR